MCEYRDDAVAAAAAVAVGHCCPSLLFSLSSSTLFDVDAVVVVGVAVVVVAVVVVVDVVAFFVALAVDFFCFWRGKGPRRCSPRSPRT